jgi:ubiquinone/menaquinone biosynthesis C-methylase UbiE
MTATVVPNHHADHSGFAGARGALMGLMFAAIGGSTARVALSAAGVGPGDRVVDVGCGPGTAARRAARAGAEVVGVDPAPVMLAVARRLTLPGAGVRWAGGGAEAVPVADGWATVLWSLACVHHWADVPAGLAEAHRVLAPGGRLLAVERLVEAGATGTASHGWTAPQADAFLALASAAGFTDGSVATTDSRRGPLLVATATRP